MNELDRTLENLTPEDLRRLADIKEEKQKVQIATLKHDLYRQKFYVEAEEVYTKEKLDELCEEFRSSFEIIVPAGTKFESFLSYGVVYWLDVDGEIEEMDNDWAKEHLENFSETDKSYLETI